MIDLLLAAVEEEPSKTLYFIAGGALALFAIGISVVGFRKPDFPRSAQQARVIMAASALLTMFVLTAVIVTS
jgi:hypothetical protein